MPIYCPNATFRGNARCARQRSKSEIPDKNNSDNLRRSSPIVQKSACIKNIAKKRMTDLLHAGVTARAHSPSNDMLANNKPLRMEAHFLASQFLRGQKGVVI